MFFKIRELKVQDEGETGVHVISFVDKPAIETDFEYFAKGQLLPFFKYTAYPDKEVIPTSHEFCKNHAGNVYHISEIQSWTSTDQGWIAEANFFQNFTNDKGGPNYEGDYSFNCDSQLYNCRHKLVRVSKKSDIPASKRALAPEIQFQEQHFVKMEMFSEPKREVQGLVLKSNQMIYRTNVDNEGNPGYVYFSRDTVRKLKEKYGYNRSISYMHRDDCTGQAILLDSWLEEDDKLNETRWFVKYKIIGDKLWEQIKSQVVKGFSIEALFSIDKPI